MDANESQRQFLNGLRKGIVTDVAGTKCRVASGNLETNWIEWFAPAAGEASEWLAPSIGEQVMLLCPSGDPAQALALRGIYSDDFPPPTTDPNKHTRQYRDGALVEYDFAAHALKADLPAGATVSIVAPGEVTVQTQIATVTADTITLDAEHTTCTGALTVQGAFEFQSGMNGKGGQGGVTIVIDGSADFTGDVTAAGTSVRGHKHQAQGEHAPTSDPL
jgi:phage baseplate assembly protein V